MTTIVAPVPLADLRADVLALYKPPLKARSTWLRVAQVFDELARSKVRTSADLDPQKIGAMLVRLHRGGMSRSSLRVTLAFVRVICDHAAEEGWLAASPFRGPHTWTIPTAPRKRPAGVEAPAGR